VVRAPFHEGNQLFVPPRAGMVGAVWLDAGLAAVLWTAVERAR
jgi:hypothetical protein